MKKISVIMFCFLLALIAACGKASTNDRKNAFIEKKEEPTIKEVDNKNSFVEKIKDTIDNSPLNEHHKPSPSTEFKTDFEPKDEIINARFCDSMIQIDDVVLELHTGESIAEMMMRIPDNYCLISYDRKTKEYGVIDNDTLIGMNTDTIYLYNTLYAPFDSIPYEEKYPAFSLKIAVNQQGWINETQVGDIDPKYDYIGSIYLAKGFPYTKHQTENNENFLLENAEAYLSEFVDIKTDNTDFLDDKNPDKTKSYLRLFDERFGNTKYGIYYYFKNYDYSGSTPLNHIAFEERRDSEYIHIDYLHNFALFSNIKWEH